jgi:hypothetical protein
MFVCTSSLFLGIFAFLSSLLQHIRKLYLLVSGIAVSVLHFVTSPSFLALALVFFILFFFFLCFFVSCSFPLPPTDGFTFYLSLHLFVIAYDVLFVIVLFSPSLVVVFRYTIHTQHQQSASTTRTEREEKEGKRNIYKLNCPRRFLVFKGGKGLVTIRNSFLYTSWVFLILPSSCVLYSYIVEAMYLSFILLYS